MNNKILIVDDDEDTRVLMSESLVRRGFDAKAVASGEDCLNYVRSHAVDVVIADVHMPRMSGISLCSTLSERHPDVVSLVVTGAGDLELAIGAIRAGAYDFLVKPVKIDVLEVALRRALEHLALKCEVKRLRSQTDSDLPIASIAGASSAIRETTQLVRRVTDSDATVLITGESGTGKELVARALHDLSPRQGQPFVAINCGAMPAPLLESELFGHVRGAFTDAKTTRAGLFLQAGRGTIFLDEVGEMPLEMQVKLLRVLQERTVRPVGGDQEVPFDARVITATNRDLESEVEEGRFREDLFYRINVVAIQVPPLRDRCGDIPLIAQRMIERITSRSSKRSVAFSSEAARKLVDYDWPGNVRELENCMERSVALCGSGPITPDHLPAKIQGHQSRRIEINTGDAAQLITLEEMERRYVRQVLESVRGNKTHAARLLGIDRRSLYRRLETPAAAMET